MQRSSSDSKCHVLRPVTLAPGSPRRFSGGMPLGGTTCSRVSSPRVYGVDIAIVRVQKRSRPECSHPFSRSRLLHHCSLLLLHFDRRRRLLLTRTYDLTTAGSSGCHGLHKGYVSGVRINMYAYHYSDPERSHVLNNARRRLCAILPSYDRVHSWLRSFYFNLLSPIFHLA